MTCHKPRDTPLENPHGHHQTCVARRAKAIAHTQQAASLFLARLRDTLPPRSFSTGQYARVQDKPPWQRWQGAYRAIHKELGKIGTHRLGRRSGRRTRVHQQNTCLFLNHNGSLLGHSAVHYPYGGVQAAGLSQPARP